MTESLSITKNIELKHNALLLCKDQDMEKNSVHLASTSSDLPDHHKGTVAPIQERLRFGCPFKPYSKEDGVAAYDVPKAERVMLDAADVIEELAEVLRDAIPLVEGGAQIFDCLPGESDRDCFYRNKLDVLKRARAALASVSGKAPDQVESK